MRAAIPVLAAYGAAHAAKSLLWYGGELLFTFVLTEIFGLAPWSAAGLSALGLGLNAAVELALGFSLARRSFTAREAARMQFAGAWLASTALLAFGVSGEAAAAWRPVAVALALCVFRTTYPVLDLPQNALLALAAPAAGGAHRLSAVRMAAGGGAALTVAMVFAPVLQGRSHAVQLDRFVLMTATASGLAVAGAGLLFAVVRRLSDAGAKAAIAPPRARAPGLGGVLALLAALAAYAAGLGLFSRLEPYLTSYTLADRWRGGGLMTLVALGAIVSQLGWGRLARGGLARTLTASALVWTAASMGLFVLLSERGPVGALMLAALLYGCGSGGAAMALWASVAAALRSRPRWTSRAFAGIGASSKIGSIGATVLAASLLSLGDYRRFGLQLLPLACLAPALVGLACAGLGWMLVGAPWLAASGEEERLQR